MLTIQSVVIPKKYKLEQAENIVKSLGFKELYLKRKVTEYKAGQTTNYWRFRQSPPSQFEKDSFRTKKVKDDIYLILGKKNNI